MPTITQLFHFDYAHRVLNHESKCRHIHGHRGVAEVTVQADILDLLGRVIDFSKLKSLIGFWINDNWDHNIILHPDDPLMKLADDPETLDEIFEGKLPFALEVVNKGCLEPANPTAENLAHRLYEVCTYGLLPDHLKVVRVRIWETPSCCADYPDPDNANRRQ